ncbi:MAG: nucleotide exchange factor GrpE [Candidatus Methanomethylicia archaeon]|nr:nucleotide exchange factor GrpE [Candidatus Methanomethylicia archaeon]
MDNPQTQNTSVPNKPEEKRNEKENENETEKEKENENKAKSPAEGEKKEAKGEAEKIGALMAALEEEKRRSEDYLNRLKYMQADFENFRKRMDRQIEEIKRQSSERIVLGLLDVVDELEMAIKNAKSSGSVETLIDGVEMTLKKLKKVLAGEGVSQIECVGKPFDPSVHEVACVVDGDSDGVVLEEVRKGYVMGGRVIRPSVVKISKKSSSTPQKEPEGENKKLTELERKTETEYETEKEKITKSEKVNLIEKEGDSNE